MKHLNLQCSNWMMKDGADDDKIPADIKTSEATKIEATTPAKEENKPAFSFVKDDE